MNLRRLFAPIALLAIITGITLLALIPRHKYRIVFFTSSGGGGHESARKAFESDFGHIYDIEPAFIFRDVLRKVDHIQTFSFGTMNGEDLYNFCIRNKMNGVLNFFYALGRFNYRLNRGQVKKLIVNYLQEQRPNLVISAIPVVNDVILKATQELNIPFLLIPTDVDVTSFIQGIKKPEYKKFHVALPFNDADALTTIEPAQIPADQISVTGFPIRPDFFEYKDHTKIKEEYNIPTNKPVILLLMGAAGSRASYDYAKELAKVRLPAHIIIALGRNKELKPKIESINWPPNITTTILEFTPRMSDFMSIADLVITKSGTVSFLEAIYSHTPMLLDANDSILKWEKFNHSLMQKHGFGCQITYNNAQWLVTGLLSHPEVLKEFKQNIINFEKKQFSSEIRTIIRKLIHS